MADLSTMAVKGMILHHATARLGWTREDASEAFDAWFGDCGAHRLFVGQDPSVGEWSVPTAWWWKCLACERSGGPHPSDNAATTEMTQHWTADGCVQDGIVTESTVSEHPDRSKT